MGVHTIPDKILRVKNIGKSVHEKKTSRELLKDINLTVHPEEFVSILGAQGCGKSTLLRVLAGLDNDFSGEISLSGKAVSGPGLKRGIIFQEPRLIPWLTVTKNIALALHNTRLTAAEKNHRVQHALDLLGLREFASSTPSQISAGLSHRTAIARALVNRPEVLVFDDPFHTLDPVTRMQLQQRLQDIWRREKITMILVTQDIDEAIFLADRIVIMEPNPGRIKRILVGSENHPRDRTGVAFNAVKRLVLAQINNDNADNPNNAYVDFNRLANVRLSW